MAAEHGIAFTPGAVAIHLKAFTLTGIGKARLKLFNFAAPQTFPAANADLGQLRHNFRLCGHIDAQNSQVIFVGDSPNDAPMFSFFNNSCGVANIRAFENDLDLLPTWVASGSGGAGFCEIANILLESQKKEK